MLSLLVVATVATMPVMFPLFEVIGQAQDDNSVIDPLELTSHGIAIALLYVLLFVWCSKVVRDETEGESY